jgi:hypothetical protein
VTILLLHLGPGSPPNPLKEGQKGDSRGTEHAEKEKNSPLSGPEPCVKTGREENGKGFIDPWGPLNLPSPPGNFQVNGPQDEGKKMQEVGNFSRFFGENKEE